MVGRTTLLSWGHFNSEQIIKTWIKVGFVPMTGNAVANDPKVRYKLGEGGGTAGGGRSNKCTSRRI